MTTHSSSPASKTSRRRAKRATSPTAFQVEVVPVEANLVRDWAFCWLRIESICSSEYDALDAEALLDPDHWWLTGTGPTITDRFLSRVMARVFRAKTLQT